VSCISRMSQAGSSGQRATHATGWHFLSCVAARVCAVTFERNVCLHQSGSIMSIHNGGQANVHDVHYKARPFFRLPTTFAFPKDVHRRTALSNTNGDGAGHRSADAQLGIGRPRPVGGGLQSKGLPGQRLPHALRLQRCLRPCA
jgi:hypothetical protein